MSLRYHKLLLPLDGSPLAEQVLQHLPWLATPADTELVLVSAIETWRYAVSGSEFAWVDTLPAIRAGTEQYIAAQCQQLQQSGYRVTMHVVEGDAAQTILDLAQTSGADCIVMSTHGRSGVARWALGSVAERVLHGARMPVFLVRATTEPRQHKLQTILLPLDGSAVAEQALPEAQALAKANDAHILLLQVMQRLDAGNQHILFKDEAAAKATFAQWLAQAETYLAGVARRLEAAGVASTQRVVVDNPDRAICALTKGNGVNLVVMGTHGRTGVRRWVYGSVANKVLRDAGCPLLLVRTLAAE